MLSSSWRVASRGADGPAILVAGREKGVADHHHGLGQIERGKIRGRDVDKTVAEPQVLVGQPAIFGPEDQGDLILPGNGDQPLGHGPGFEHHLALAPQAGRGAHHILAVLQGVLQTFEGGHAVHHVAGGMGGHHADAVFGRVFRLDDRQPGNPHIAGRPGRRPDVFRVAGPVQNDPHPGQVDAVGHQPTISKLLKK